MRAVIMLLVGLVAVAMINYYVEAWITLREAHKAAEKVGVAIEEAQTNAMRAVEAIQRQVDQQRLRRPSAPPPANLYHPDIKPLESRE